MNKIEYGTEFLDQLKDRVHDLYDENKELKQKVERLNNILDSIENEVRNTTEEMYKTLVKIDGRGYYVANLTRLDYLLDKIKKLKGDDKE